LGEAGGGAGGFGWAVGGFAPPSPNPRRSILVLVQAVAGLGYIKAALEGGTLLGQLRARRKR
jgi:hypothetical protein